MHFNELIASKTRASPVILNEGKDRLHLNEEILRCALLDFQETTRNEFKTISHLTRLMGNGTMVSPRLYQFLEICSTGLYKTKQNFEKLWAGLQLEIE